MSIIVPAILPSSRDDLEEKLSRLVGLVESVQIDVVDGRFAAPASWPYVEGGEEFAALAARGGMVPHLADFDIEVDLMARDPEQVTGTWVAVGASRITIHLESTEYLPRIITDFQTKYGYGKDFVTGLLSFGLALNIESDLSLIEPHIDSIDYVQFMGIDRIGVQGQPFDPAVLEKIKLFRRAHPDTQIQVDGGVSLATAPALLSAGVSRLIVGSALLHAPDLKAELEKFDDLVHKYGRYE